MQANLTRALIGIYGAMIIGLASYMYTVYPNTGDEHAVYFQAQIFASGRIVAPAPSLPNLFATDYVRIENGNWFSEHPPFNSLIHAPFFALGFKSLGMGVFAALFLLLFMAFMQRQGVSPLASTVAGIALAFSPTFIFHSASYLSHVPAALLFLLALDQGGRFRDGQGDLRLVALPLGLLAVCRPFDAFLLAPSLIWWMGAANILNIGGRSLVSAVLIGAAPVALTIFFSVVATGSWTIPYFTAAAADGALFNLTLGWTEISRAWLLFIETGAWVGAGIFDSGIPRTRLPTDFNFGLHLFVVLWIIATYRAVRHRDRLAILAVVSGASMIFGFAFFDGAMKGRFGGRYMFTALPLLFIPFAQALEHEIRARSKIILTVAAVLLLGLYSYGLFSTIRVFRNENPSRLELFMKAEKSQAGTLIFVRDAPLFHRSWYIRNHPELKGTVIVPFLSDSENLRTLEIFKPAQTLYYPDYTEAK